MDFDCEGIWKMARLFLIWNFHEVLLNGKGSDAKFLFSSRKNYSHPIMIRHVILICSRTL